MSGVYSKTGGSLKLKGATAGPSNKKKKKSSSSKRLREEEAVGGGSGSEREGSASAREGERDESRPSAGSSTGLSGKTDAQRKFEEVQKKRLLEKAAKLANKTHKERVAEFNEKLEAMSEHHDIPRVGPG